MDNLWIISMILCLVGGIPTPLKNMKVNWDDDIPNVWEKNMFQTTNQMQMRVRVNKQVAT